ncbi:MAG: substrate-binding domain-containing protein, partial [Oscillospiraceae bacterium]|nr:substrate-binding domain-containing protein [Oscillospiraceae bacterium]
RRILYLAGPDYSSSQVDRLEGCLRALRERELPMDTLRIIHGNHNLADESIRDVLFPVHYTAIISFRDEIAFFALRALEERKVRVPEDVSLVSFDHLRGDFSYLPGVTSVYTEKNEAAQHAVSLLMSRIENPSFPGREVILPVRLYDEGSTAPPAFASVPIVP